MSAAPAQHAVLGYLAMGYDHTTDIAAELGVTCGYVHMILRRLRVLGQVEIFATAERRVGRRGPPRRKSWCLTPAGAERLAALDAADGIVSEPAPACRGGRKRQSGGSVHRATPAGIASLAALGGPIAVWRAP